MAIPDLFNKDFLVAISIFMTYTLKIKDVR